MGESGTWWPNLEGWTRPILGLASAQQLHMLEKRRKATKSRPEIEREVGEGEG